MNTLKRLLSLALALTIALSVLCSCGKIEETPGGSLATEDPVVSDVPVVTDAPETTPEATTTTPATTPEETTTTPATTPEVTTTPATTPEVTTTKDKNDFSVEEMDETTMYATMSLNVRSGPSTDFGKIATLKEGEAVTVVGRASTGWYQIVIDEDTLGYVSNVYITADAPNAEEPEEDDDDAVVIPDDDDAVVVPDDDDDDKPSSGSTTPDIGGVTANSDWVEDNGWTYMYNALYENRYRQALSEIMAGIKNHEDFIEITPTFTDSEWDDFASFFFPIVSVEYTYVRSIGKIKGSNSMVGVNYYTDNKSEADKMVKELRSEANKVIGKLKDSWSDYQKIKYMHDWLVKNCKADEHSYAEKDSDGNPTEWAGKWGTKIWPNTAYGSIVDGRPTCLGYAKGMFYLLSKAGYDVTFAEGIGVSALHIWVKVKVDGKWYNIDPTWDDPYGAAQNADPNYIAYSFLMVTDKYMKESRSEVYDIKFFDDPSCTSSKYDWYMLNDCYVSSYDEVEAILKAKAKEAAKSGDDITYVTIKMDSASVFKKVDEAWTGAKFTKLLEGYTTEYKTVKKGKNTNHRVITFRLYKD